MAWASSGPAALRRQQASGHRNWVLSGWLSAHLFGSVLTRTGGEQVAGTDISPLCYRLLAVKIARLAARPVEASTWWRVEGIGVGKLERNALNSEPESLLLPPEPHPDEISWDPCAGGVQGSAGSAIRGVCALRLQIFFRGTSATAVVDDSVDGNGDFGNENRLKNFQRPRRRHFSSI